MGTAAPQDACYLAEWYRPEVTLQPLDDTVAKLDAVAATMRVEGSPVNLLVTLAVPTEEVIYGVFAACSPDMVVQACRRAGIPLERLSSDVAARITRVAWGAAINHDLRETPDSSLDPSCNTNSIPQTERP